MTLKITIHQVYGSTTLNLTKLLTPKPGKKPGMQKLHLASKIGT